MEVFTNETVSTALLTLAGGILLYLSSECYNTIIKEPYQKYTNLRSEIAYAVIYYSNVYLNPNVKVSDEMRAIISEQFRGLAAKYVATMENMSLRGLRQLINEIPNDKDNKLIVGCLIYISNNINSNVINQSMENNKKVDTIKAILKYKVIGEV